MSAPIGNTCPDIDKAVKRLQLLIKQIDKFRDYEYENVDFVKDFISECHYAMDASIDSFEDLRKDNDTLRSWGKEMEEEAETLQVRVVELEEKISELKEQLAAIELQY